MTNEIKINRNPIKQILKDKFALVAIIILAIMYLAIALADFFIIICNLSIGACLFFVVSFYGIIEQFMVHSSNVFIAVSYVVLGAFFINIFCHKFSVVMVYRAFARHYRYCSLHSIFHLAFLYFQVSDSELGFCYFCQK